MQKQQQVIRKHGSYLIAASLPVQILLVQLISTQPAWVERVYTGNFYQVFSRFLRTIFGSFSFPIGQLLFYAIIAAGLVWLTQQVYRVITKKIRFTAFTLNLLRGTFTFLAVFYFLFMVFWGLNYHRLPVQSIVQLGKTTVSASALEQLCRRLIVLTNASRRQLTPNEQQPLHLPISHRQLLTKAPQGFWAVAQKYPALNYSHPAVKSVYIPQLMSFFGVGGIYFPFTGEANVNMDPPDFLLPATVCHEMAHQIGFASEDEANYVAYLACRLNPDPSFGYSGNLMAMKYAMNRLKKMNPTTFTRLEKSYSTGVVLDLQASREYWNKFQNPVAEFSDVFYDLFLKANDQKAGIESYSKMVELILGEYRKNGLSYPRQVPLPL
jgi:hypothetical protein